MRSDKFYWIAAAPLLALAQIPAFVSWTVNVSPWDTALADVPLVWAIVSSVLLIVVGAVVLAGLLYAPLGLAGLIRRTKGSREKLAGMARHVSLGLGLVLGVSAAALLEWAMVGVMKAGS